MSRSFHGSTRRTSASPAIPSPARPRRITFPWGVATAILATVLLVLAAHRPAQAGTVAVVDDLGREIRLERPARRVVALYSAFNEIFSAMGLGDRLLARTKADDFSSQVCSLPSVGTHMRPNVELVLGLAPDLVVQLGGRKQALMVEAQLTAQGLPVAVFNPKSVDDLFSVIERLGRLAGAEDAARALARDMKSRLDAVAARLDGVEHRPTVFFEIRHPDLLGAGKASIVDDVITRAGGVNVLAVNKKIVHLGQEALLGLNPECYVIQRGPMNRNPSPLSARSRFKSLRATGSGRVLMVDEAVFSRPGPRVVEAVETLAGFLHPEAMAILPAAE